MMNYKQLNVKIGSEYYHIAIPVLLKVIEGHARRCAIYRTIKPTPQELKEMGLMKKR